MHYGPRCCDSNISMGIYLCQWSEVVLDPPIFGGELFSFGCKWSKGCLGLLKTDTVSNFGKTIGSRVWGLSMIMLPRPFLTKLGTSLSILI